MSRAGPRAEGRSVFLYVSSAPYAGGQAPLQSMGEGPKLGSVEVMNPAA